MSDRRGENAGGDLDPDEAYWGLCPTCHRNDGYLNLGREHWYVCHDHRFKWCIGENLFSSWRHETGGVWAENRERLKGYAEIEPERQEDAEVGST